MLARPDLPPRVLRYFVALAEAGSYTRAAAALHISIPSLSQQIRKTENELGVTLLERDHRGANLTPAGEELLDFARQILTLHDVAISRVRARHVSAPAQIRIGFYTTIAGPRTHPILDALRSIAPATLIELVHLTWGDQVTAVTEGRVDASFARPPFTASGVVTHPVLTEDRVLIMSTRHPLAAKEFVTVADLADVVQVATENVPEDWRRWWALDPRPDGSNATYGTTIHSMEEMLEVIATSDTVGITASSVADTMPRGDLVYRPIIGVDPAQIVLVTPVDARPATALLLRALELSGIASGRPDPPDAQR